MSPKDCLLDALFCYHARLGHDTLIMTPPSVLIFDSGAGGLSIAAEIRTLLPTLPIHYLMDDAAFPYGQSQDEWLSKRIVSICTAAQQRINASILVVACNTASTLVLDKLRKNLTIPVVGVVPAIKTAARLTQTGEIGLLATPATIKRPYTRQLIQDFASHCQVRLKGSVELVHWAEFYMANGQVAEALFEHLDEWITRPLPLSHVVLGCTHFPLLRQELEKRWPETIWIDSGAAIARRVSYCLAQQGYAIPTSGCDTYLWWTSDQPQHAIIQNYLESLGPVRSSLALSNTSAEHR